MKKIFIILSLWATTFYNNLNAIDYETFPKAKVQVLNKLTGKYKTLTIPIDKVLLFDDNLYLTVKKCYKSLQVDQVDNVAFLEIMKTINSGDSVYSSFDSNTLPKYFIDIKTNLEKKFIFSGWMFSSSPSLSYLEDSIYDVVLIGCINNP